MDIKSILEDITADSIQYGESHHGVWENMPSDFISGAEWRGEIADMASQLAGYDLNADNLDDISNEIANSECEDYYLNIANRFHELKLWAYDDLDEEVAELAGGEGMTANKVMSLYLYCAMRGLAYAVGSYALEQAEELANA